MKKISAIILTSLIILSLAACAGNRQPSASDASNTVSNTQAESLPSGGTEQKTNDSEDAEVLPENSEREQPEEAAESNGDDTVNGDEAINDEAVNDETVNDKAVKDKAVNDETVNRDDAVNNDSTASEVKVLVVYFSATNTTEGVAEKLAGQIGADLYEIVPENPYTDADLNYHDNNSRTTMEMNDSDVRPAISGSLENMEQYEVIFLGYPIWWGEAPRIINTFVESYDFSGKTIVPFCTSGSSGIGSSAANLHSAAGDAEWLDGRRFSGSVSEDELAEWAAGLNLN